MQFNFELTNKGYLKRRESFNLEYKLNFQLGDNLLKYIKTLVGMANNKGGHIVFGVKNSPHEPIGLTDEKLNNIDPAKIDRTIREFFSPELIWDLITYQFDSKNFGIVTIKESENKPIICKKNGSNILKEGAIYYRYRAETKEIEYAELKNILEIERVKERYLWMDLIQKIGQNGPKNISILNTYNGEIEVGNQKVLLDENILDKIKFIKEGRFTEKQGEGIPTLRIIGDIDGIIGKNSVIDPNLLYPYLSKEIQKLLNLNQHQFKCIIWKLKIKGNKKYHTEIRVGENSNPTHKYSNSFINILKRLIKNEKFVNDCCIAYSKNKKSKLI